MSTGGRTGHHEVAMCNVGSGVRFGSWTRGLDVGFDDHRCVAAVQSGRHNTNGLTGVRPAVDSSNPKVQQREPAEVRRRGLRLKPLLWHSMQRACALRRTG
jgi:hypothetical protein